MKRIMVVDDHEDIIRLTRDILSTRNYLVEGALNGKECLEKVKKFNPDMILLDIIMPGMDGWQVLDELKRTGGRKKSEIVIYTVKNRFEEDMKRIDQDDVHYLPKPITVHDLLDATDDIFKGAR